ncbi:MAG TPA: thioesterase domain-containing protein [Gemmatimonadales bacterium]|nr:thioesterase domain-containing protein [Gemmatimonadales bacterium]
MRLPELLGDLRKREVRLWADGDRLRCRAPEGVLTPELRHTLQERKREIIEFLRSGAALAEQQRAIVPLQGHGTRTPVFAVAGHNGDVFCYRALVEHLGDDQPFFGLQPPGLDGQSKPLTRVEELARYFAGQIRGFRPSGAYVIVGYCAGGSVAFELARQLQQAGAAIGFVGLFGSPYPTWYRFLPQLRRRVVQQVDRVGRHARALVSLSSSELRQYVAERLRQRKSQRDEARAVAMDPVLTPRAMVESATLAAVRDYTPDHFAGRVGLFLPCRGWLRLGEAGLGWRSVAQATTEYFGPDNCDGDNMLREHAARFAELFRRCRDAHDGQPATTAPGLSGPLLAASATR